MKQFSNLLRGKRVLVTGAAGSIGSALCEAIAPYQPEALAGLDLAPSAAITLVADIRDAGEIRQAVRELEPHLIFHAAALKHVPALQAASDEAIETNVFGTLHVVRAAQQFATEKLILVSTDKAVKPASVMGGTKRICELLMTRLNNQPTKLITVRLGNVLGSSGSVVPIFAEQIAAGGPLTITHRAMQRYFLSIGDATAALLCAAAIGKGGEIFVPEMGEPVAIVHLAERMLKGHPGVSYTFTGTRPGEKLSEELFDPASEELAGCIGALREYRPKPADLWQHLQDLRSVLTPNEDSLSVLRPLLQDASRSHPVLQEQR